MKIDLPPYLKDYPVWVEHINGKHILFDNDVLISIIENKATKLLDDLKELKCVNCILEPIKLELFATNSKQKRSQRELLIDNNDFITFPLRKEITKSIYDIQMYLAEFKCYPSPSDLYLAAILNYHSSNNKTFLLTGNHKDFPYPLFKRETYLILQNSSSQRIFTFYSFNTSILKEHLKFHSRPATK